MIKQFKAKVRVKNNGSPHYHRARPVLFALKEEIGRELDHLEKKGILKRYNIQCQGCPYCSHAEEGRFGFFKVMVNSVLEIDKPKLDYFFAALEGGSLNWTSISSLH